MRFYDFIHSYSKTDVDIVNSKLNVVYVCNETS